MPASSIAARATRPISASTSGSSSLPNGECAQPTMQASLMGDLRICRGEILADRRAHGDTCEATGRPQQRHLDQVKARHAGRQRNRERPDTPHGARRTPRAAWTLSSLRRVVLTRPSPPSQGEAAHRHAIGFERRAALSGRRRDRLAGRRSELGDRPAVAGDDERGTGPRRRQQLAEILPRVLVGDPARRLCCLGPLGPYGGAFGGTGDVACPDFAGMPAGASSASHPGPDRCGRSASASAVIVRVATTIIAVTMRG